MSSLSRNARIAGLLYLGVVLLGPVRLIYIPSVLFVAGNAAATAQNIAAHEHLFRFGIYADLFTATIEIFVVLALYRLLNGVDRTVATIMVILGLADVPIYFINTLNDFGARLFARGADSLAAVRHPRLQVGFSAADSRRVAYPERCCLSGAEFCRRPAAAVRGSRWERHLPSAAR